MRISASPKPFAWLSGRQWPSDHLWPNTKLQGGEPLHQPSPDWLEQNMPSPASSNCRVMREQRTLALARVLQSHAKESGCPTGVLCDAARELQWCMAPLLALSGDEIVGASLLQPVEGELSWSIWNLISNLTTNLTLKCSMCLCCWDRGAGTAHRMDCHSYHFSLISSFFPKSSPFPKGKKSRGRATGADAVVAAQWVCSYLEDNYRVPE